VAKIDTTAFPDLARLMSQRERERNYVRSRRDLGDGKGESIMEFWEELAERIEQEEELDNMEAMIREIRSDMDMLKGVQQTLELNRGDSEHAAQISQLVRIIRMLLDICEKFKRRHWWLRDRALAYYMAVNRAMPSKADQKYKTEKDKKKEGQAKAKEAVDQTQQGPKAKGAKDKKRARPTKKMEA